MKKKIIIGVSLAVVIVALITVGIVKNAGSVGSGAVFTVQTGEIKKGDVSSFISANGTVSEIEKSEVYIDNPVKVTKLYVKQNDTVKKGQKLADIDLDDLNTQLETQKLQKKSQELLLRKAMTADTTISTVNNQNEIKAAENDVASKQRAYEQALKNRNEKKALYDAEAISKVELDSAENTLKDAEDILSVAKLTLQAKKDAQNETSKTNSKSKAAQQIDIESQQVTIQTTEVAIKDLENKIKKYKASMFSTMDGIVSQVNVAEGSYTMAGQPVFVVINPDKLEVKLNINEFNAKLLKPGQAVELSGDSIPETEEVTGKVKSVAPMAKANTTNTGSSETVIPVVISIDNITPSMKPGITVSCDIKTVDISNVLTVDLDMMGQDKDDSKYVFVISPDKKTMQKKKIELGTTSDMKAELVGGGLKEGDLVVMNPNPAYKDGARVKIKD
ncbi:efflux RND transporter periplasmic adaptor subunit [Clostridium sp. BNL1100]|uniref:efflux RND transporter periplasmic adaptor subunit n=1 Tax=Clostridium sp. BNL1100 TaxID=755731 RepID=UPI00024A7A50|nr:efflux RND transporter periplasmic adaptor subunit [Clostridium sp. BNL1100]AEY65698.1 RND family efflux transporter, MFP subunit [Clostridium sp. BNL1100]